MVLDADIYLSEVGMFTPGRNKRLARGPLTKRKVPSRSAWDSKLLLSTFLELSEFYFLALLGR